MMKKKLEINSIVDYETYLLDKYGFYPFGNNAGTLWEMIIETESKGKYVVWYKKFIKKYYSKRLLPKEYLKKALLVAGCNPNEVDEVVRRNEAKEIVGYFRRKRKIRKLRCFYSGK